MYVCICVNFSTLLKYLSFNYGINFGIKMTDFKNWKLPEKKPYFLVKIKNKKGI